MKVSGKLGDQRVKINQSKLLYIKKIIEIYDKNKGVFPDVDIISEKANLKKYEIIHYLRLLIEENFIIRDKNSFKLVKEKIKEPEKSVNGIKSKININNWIDILKYLILIIGIGASYMSIYYSYIWLLDFLSSFKAFILAFIMVIFAICSFELIIWFKQNKKIKIMALFSFLWIIVTIFSMMSTVAGQYNARMKTINERYKDISVLKSYQENERNIKEEKQEIKNQIKELKSELSRYKKIISNFDTQEKIEENKKFYGSAKWRYNYINKLISRNYKKLNVLRSKKDKKVIKKSPDFYLWVSELFGLDPGRIQFWMSIFPALFIDIIAPLSFAIVMFLRKKKDFDNEILA